MARIRSVHPELCIDDALALTSAPAERTFVRLWPHLDDEGRAVDNALLLKAALYPLHLDVTTEDLEHDLTELASRGLITRYEVDGKRYLAAKPDAWSRYQKPRHKIASKLPAPDRGTLWTTALPADETALQPSAQTASTNRNDTPSDIRPTHVGHAAAGEEGSRRGVGDGEELAAQPLAESDTRARTPEQRQPLLTDLAEPDRITDTGMPPAANPGPDASRVEPSPAVTAVERTQRVHDAIDILVDRHIAANPSRVSVKRHREAVRHGKLADYRDNALAMLEADPELTANDLAALLEIPPPALPERPYGPTPRDLANACPRCHNGLLELDDGRYAQCDHEPAAPMPDNIRNALHTS